jgi:CBS-domain-containing membrane protein
MITVDEIMTTELITVSTDCSLKELTKLMNEHKVRHLPVLENEQLAGLVSHRDILAASGSSIGSYIPAERELSEEIIKARDVMTENIETIGPHANLRQAALKLQKNKYGCLPVTEQGRLIGIVTEYDFVGVAINLLEQIELAAPLNASEALHDDL